MGTKRAHALFDCRQPALFVFILTLRFWSSRSYAILLFTVLTPLLCYQECTMCRLALFFTCDLFPANVRYEFGQRLCFGTRIVESQNECNPLNFTWYRISSPRAALTTCTSLRCAFSCNFTSCMKLSEICHEEFRFQSSLLCKCPFELQNSIWNTDMLRYDLIVLVFGMLCHTTASGFQAKSFPLYVYTTPKQIQ